MVLSMLAGMTEEIILLRPGKPGGTISTEALIQDEEQVIYIFNVSFPVNVGSFFVRKDKVMGVRNDILGVTYVQYFHASTAAHIKVGFTKSIAVNIPEREPELYITRISKLPPQVKVVVASVKTSCS